MLAQTGSRLWAFCDVTHHADGVGAGQELPGLSQREEGERARQRPEIRGRTANSPTTTLRGRRNRCAISWCAPARANTNGIN